MKTLKKECYLIIITAVLLAQVINAQTWEEIGFKLPDGDKASNTSVITFMNKDTGWLVTYAGSNTAKVFKTINGGQNWQKIRTIKKNNFFLTAAFSMKPDFFYMINTDLSLSNGYNANFTTDGGITWDSTEIINGGFNLLHFYTEDKGIAIGGGNSWITTDKGLTWQKKGKVSLENDIYFCNERLGWMAGIGPNADGGHVAKTTDGGITWEYKSDYFPELNGIAFIDSLKGFAVCGTGGGDCFITTDGGENWNVSSSSNNKFGLDVEFLDEKNGWISSWGQIYRTSDGGLSWISQFDHYLNYRFIKLVMLKEDKTAYILGVNPDSNSATLFRADLSSITAVEDNKRIIPGKYSLSQNYPNPFNPHTTINYQLAESGHVTLKIFDIMGREVAVLVDENKQPGKYSIQFFTDKYSLTSGVYIARLTTGNFTAALKMILQK